MFIEGRSTHSRGQWQEGDGFGDNNIHILLKRTTYKYVSYDDLSLLSRLVNTAEMHSNSAIITRTGQDEYVLATTHLPYLPLLLDLLRDLYTAEMYVYQPYRLDKNGTR